MCVINPVTAERHRMWTVVAALFAGAVAACLPSVGLTLQFWLILIPVALFGLSHGGADPVIINALKVMRGRSHAQWLTAYILLMALAVAFIVWQPMLALWGFLALSIWHFAITDCMFLPKGGHAGVGWLSASLPVIGPMAGHPEQVSMLFAWLLQQDPAVVMAAVRPLGRLLILGWGVALVGAIALTSRGSRLMLLLELCALAAPMLLLPPLLAFAFYFCMVHSLRHFLLILGAERQASQAMDVSTLARRAAPATVGAIVLGALAWWFINTHGGANHLADVWLADSIKVIFWGLAVVTVPHALLVALWLACQHEVNN